MKRFEIELTGVTPMIQNRMPAEVLEGIRLKTKKKYTAPKDPREDAATKVHVHEQSGEPIVTVDALMACLIAAGQYIKLDGKRQMSTKSSTLLPGFVTIEQNHLPLMNGQGPATWEVDVRQGRNPNGGEAVCLVRPRFDHWRVKLTMILDTDSLSEDLYRELVDIAGTRIGLYEFRPARKGIYGKFKVTHWQEVSE